MIEAMSLQQAQHVTGGIHTGSNAVFAAVSIDTRSLQAGELFVALKGPNFNGNAFVATAAEKGACAALVSEAVVASVPTLEVADTRIALGQLGAHNRRRSTARVIGLTGSQGKTTVKEMTAAILACRGAVLHTQGNLNNDYGVPLTLLRIGPEHHFAVIEMGANAGGEIAYTTALASPDIAHITNVAPTHLEGFGSLQGVAKAKAEIWQGLAAGGTAVVNLDDDNINACFSAATGVRKVGISAAGKGNADYALETWDDHGLAGSGFTLRTPQGRVAATLSLPGRHNAANALAAAALAMEAGAEPFDVVKGLAALRPVKGRLNFRAGRSGAVLLDDTYNASPASFAAALAVLRQQPGLHVVVAGDMGELGPDSAALHTALGRQIKAAGVVQLVCTGTLSRYTAEGFGAGALHVTDCAAAVVAVLPLLAPGISVLVKGSRSAGMERVVKQLLDQED